MTRNIIFKAISIILLMAFIALDISWASPPEIRSNNHTLATESPFQPRMITQQAGGRAQTIFLRSALLHSVYDISEYFFGNDKRGMESLPSRFAEAVITTELGKALEEAGITIEGIVPVEYLRKISPDKLKIALDGIGFKGTFPDEGVVFILYKKGDEKFLVQAALKSEVSPGDLPGYELADSDKYVVKYVPKDYALSKAKVIEADEAPEVTISGSIKEADAYRFATLTDEELLADYLNEQNIQKFELQPEDAAYLRGKVVLVLGAGGAIGAEIVRQLIDKGTDQIVLIDNNENNIYDIRRELRESYGMSEPQATCLLADVRNKEKLRSILDRHHPDIVFHYANYKSLTLGNVSPGEFADVNIGGTKNLLEVACSSPGVERFVYISSDKAESPGQNYGRTKRINELLIQAAAIKHPNIKFGSMRYCNVLDSAGCFVISTFRDQIAHNKPITVRRMKNGEIPNRYYIPRHVAAKLAIITGCNCDNGEIFSLDKGIVSPIEVDEIARALARKLGIVDVDSWFEKRVKFVKSERGEKKSEELGKGEHLPGTPLIKMSAGNPVDGAWLNESIDGLLKLSNDIGNDQLIEKTLKDIVDAAEKAKTEILDQSEDTVAVTIAEGKTPNMTCGLDGTVTKSNELISTENPDPADDYTPVVIEDRGKYKKFNPVKLKAAPTPKGKHLSFRTIEGSVKSGDLGRLRKRASRALKYLHRNLPVDWPGDILITTDISKTEAGKRRMAEFRNNEIRLHPAFLEEGNVLADLFNSSQAEAEKFLEIILLEEILHSAGFHAHKIVLSRLSGEYLRAYFNILNPSNRNGVSCSEDWYRKVKKSFVSSKVDLSGLTGFLKGGRTRYVKLLKSGVYGNTRNIVADKARADMYGFESAENGIFGPVVEESRYSIQNIIDEWHDMGIKVMLHCGIGGQALGNRALLEPAASYESDRKVIVLEKLGYDFNKIFDDLEKEGIDASEVCIHVSSKSGVTDEVMINFQGCFHALITRLSKEKFNDERPALAALEKLSKIGDITELSEREIKNLNFSDEVSNLLWDVLRRIIFTTTLGKEKGSRLYALARCPLTREILGPAGIPVVGIPDNIGGRFSERSPSGDVTSAFIGRDIFKIAEGGHEILDIYTSDNPDINPALKAAGYLHLFNPDYIVIAVQASNMEAVALALAQKFPESWGKNGKGPMVLTCTGQAMLDKMAQVMEKRQTAFIIINVDGEKVKPLTLEKYSKSPYFIYTQIGLGEKEDARRLLFFDELTKWYGELNAGGTTGDYKSPDYAPLDFQVQPYVDIGKKILRETANLLSRGPNERNSRYSSFFTARRRIPQLKASNDITPVKNIHELMRIVWEKIFVPAGDMPKITDPDEDSNFLARLKQIKRLLGKKAGCTTMREIQQIDTKIYNLFEKIADYGRSPQPAYIERLVLNLVFFCACHLIYGKIPLPIFYTPQEEAEILGRWYKHIMKSVPNEFGIGTREQHSYFQSLLGGKNVALPILVDVFTPLDNIMRTQAPIQYMGLAQEYLKGLFPDEVRRLYLEAECDAFTSSKIPDDLKKRIKTKQPRDCAILRIWDLSTETGLIEAFRFFGRFTALLSRAVSILSHEISVEGTRERLIKKLGDTKGNEVLTITEEALAVIINHPGLLDPKLLEALSRQPLKVAQATWKDQIPAMNLEKWHVETYRRVGKNARDEKLLHKDIRWPYILMAKINRMRKLKNKQLSTRQWLEAGRRMTAELLDMDVRVAKNGVALFGFLSDGKSLPTHLLGTPGEFTYHEIHDDSGYLNDLESAIPGMTFKLRGLLEHKLNEPRGGLCLEPPTNEKGFLALKLNRSDITEEDMKSFSKLAMAECIRAAEFFAPIVHPEKPFVPGGGFIKMFAEAEITLPEDLTVNKFLELVKSNSPATPSLTDSPVVLPSPGAITQLFEIVEQTADMTVSERDPGKIEANGIAVSLIALARRAKKENQGIVIPIALDGIPGYLNEASYQSQAIKDLAREIESIPDMLDDMGLDNVKVVFKNRRESIPEWITRTRITITNPDDLSNVFVLACDKIIKKFESAFQLESMKNEARPFLANINPEKLTAFYEEYGESRDRQLKIQIMTMFYIMLELALGKEAPNLPDDFPIAVRYTGNDKQNRMVYFIPKAEEMKYQDLERYYNAKALALHSA